MARAFRVPAFSLDRRDRMEDVLAEWLATPGPALLHARIDSRANVWPLVPPNHNNAQMLDPQPAADAAPPSPHDRKEDADAIPA